MARARARATRPTSLGASTSPISSAAPPRRRRCSIEMNVVASGGGRGADARPAPRRVRRPEARGAHARSSWRRRRCAGSSGLYFDGSMRTREPIAVSPPPRHRARRGGPRRLRRLARALGRARRAVGARPDEVANLGGQAVATRAARVDAPARTAYPPPAAPTTRRRWRAPAAAGASASAAARSR